jgi:hypothetical protein
LQNSSQEFWEQFTPQELGATTGSNPGPRTPGDIVAKDLGLEGDNADVAAVLLNDVTNKDLGLESTPDHPITFEQRAKRIQQYMFNNPLVDDQGLDTGNNLDGDFLEEGFGVRSRKPSEKKSQNDEDALAAAATSSSSSLQAREGLVPPDQGAFSQPSQPSQLFQPSNVPAVRRDLFQVGPATAAVVQATSTRDFLHVLVSYLNLKSNTWSLPPTTIDNCWDNLFMMYDRRGFGNLFEQSLVKYFNSTSNKTTLDRTQYIEFLKKSLNDKIISWELDQPELRLGFAGKPLTRAVEGAMSERDKELYMNNRNTNNTNTPAMLNPDETAWIKECVEKRARLYIDNPDINLGTALENTKNAQKDMKQKISKDYEKWIYWKQQCGICWICGHPIYFYFITETVDVNGKRIYLNTKCGEVEHVLPPMVGEWFGTLHPSAHTYNATVGELGTESLYTYGLAPSHAFCNQLKKMFIFSSLLFGGNVDKDWLQKVKQWFKNTHYDSYEFYPGFVESWSTEGLRNPTPADIYAANTLANVNEYFDKNIVPIIGAQAGPAGHTTLSVAMLKLAIACQQHAYAQSQSFRYKWDGKEHDGESGSDAARDTGSAAAPSKLTQAEDSKFRDDV